MSSAEGLDDGTALFVCNYVFTYVKSHAVVPSPNLLMGGFLDDSQTLAEKIECLSSVSTPLH